MKENMVWFDFQPSECWTFIDGLIEVINMCFLKEVCFNAIMSTIKENLIKYLKYVIFTLSHLLNQKKHKMVVSWQQFYGLSFTFFYKLFHLKEVNKLVIMDIIYITQKLIGINTNARILEIV